MGRFDQLPASSLLGAKIESVSLSVELARPYTAALRSIDSTWPALRRSGAPSATWSWGHIAEESRECLGLRETSDFVVLWAGRGVLQLDEGPALRLDYLEVRGDKVRSGLGRLCMATICLRARELGADRLVYGVADHPDALAFHRGIGASERTRPGWQTTSDAIAFVLEPGACAALVGVLRVL